MRAGFTGMFLNGGEKENKRRGGDRDRTLDTCVEEKNKKKRNEMKEKKNNIKNKKILTEKCYHNIFTTNYFYNNLV